MTSTSFKEVFDIQLSPEQEDQIQKAWEVFDNDNSGQIDAAELNEVMMKLGLRPTEEELKDIICEIDKDKDGTIDYSEFLRLMGVKLKNA